MKNENAAAYVPPMDIFENEEAYTVWLDLPGVDPKNVDVRCENGRLRIWGKAEARQDEKTGYLLREYGVGDFQRELNVTDTVDLGRVAAESADGVLVITLPKAAAAKPRRIEVRTG